MDITVLENPKHVKRGEFINYFIVEIKYIKKEKWRIHRTYGQFQLFVGKLKEAVANIGESLNENEKLILYELIYNKFPKKTKKIWTHSLFHSIAPTKEDTQIFRKLNFFLSELAMFIEKRKEILNTIAPIFYRFLDIPVACLLMISNEDKIQQKVSFRSRAENLSIEPSSLSSSFSYSRGSSIAAFQSKKKRDRIRSMYSS